MTGRSPLTEQKSPRPRWIWGLSWGLKKPISWLCRRRRLQLAGQTTTASSRRACPRMCRGCRWGNCMRLSPRVLLRPGQLRQVEWSDIDFGEAIWVISAERTTVRRRRRQIRMCLLSKSA